MATDYDTPLGQLRLLLNDDLGEAPQAVFADVQLNAFLALEGDNIKLAAATALDVVADDELLTSKVIRSQDLATNGAALAKELRARAAQLRKEGNASGTSLAPRGSFPDAPCWPTGFWD